MMKIIYNLLIISVLCFYTVSCKCSSDTIKKSNKDRTDTTDDVVDEQMQDYEEAMRQ